MKWEHARIKLFERMETSIVSQLDTFGQEGWELVAVDNGIAYFKRQIPIDNTDFGKYIPKGGVSTRDMAGKTSDE